MRLQALTLEQAQQVRLWRNQCLQTLRTPYPLTEEMQERFYRDVVSNRDSPHRYWAVKEQAKVLRPDEAERCGDVPVFIGMAGLCTIEWENRQAEISLIIDPELQGKGYGEKAVHLLLDEAFNYLNLELVYGECYWCNERGIAFWQKIVSKYGGETKVLRKGKYWNSSFHGTMYFDINKEEFNKHR